MTDEEIADITLAEAWAEENGFDSDCNNINSVEANGELVNAFLAGFKAGKDMNVPIKWHKVADGDLPNTDDKEHEYVVSDNLGCRMLARYYCGKWSNYGLIDNVIAWCELTTFKE